MTNIVNPNIVRTLEVWSGHIRFGDNTLLTKIVHGQENAKSFILYDLGFYYRIYITEEVDVAELLSLGFSTEFVNIVKESLRLTCQYIDIDSDAKKYPELPEFNW